MTNDTPAAAPSPTARRGWGRWLWRRFPVALPLVMLAAVGWSRYADWKREQLSEQLSGLDYRYQYEDPDLLAPFRQRIWNRLMRSVGQSRPPITEVSLSGPEFNDDWFRQHESKFAWREAVSLQLNKYFIREANVPITYATIERISRWKNLVELTINGPIQGKPDVGRLGNFRKLTRLSIRNSLSPEVFAHIARGGRLEEVLLSGDMVTSEVVEALSRNPRLTSLEIEREGLAYDLTRKTWVRFPAPSVNDDALHRLKDFKPPTGQLDGLYLNHVHCTSAGIASLVEYKWARGICLELHAEGLDATAFDLLGSCGNIVALSIDGPTDDTLRHLANYHPQWTGQPQLPKLKGQTIYLQRIQWTENTWSLLKNLGQLPRFKIRDYEITDEEYEQLRETLPNLLER